MTTAAQKHAQRNRGTLFVEDGELIRSSEFGGDQYIMRIRAPKCAAAARPGTFVHVTCDDALPMRRPLSIMRAGDDWIEVLYKIVGEGLRLLAGKQPGDRINVLGPIGQPFRPDPARPKALLIGGGVGIPPMVFLAEALRDADAQPLAILGSEIPFPFELEASAIATPWAGDDIVSTMPLLEEWGVPTRLTSLAGFEGCYRGYVTDLAELWLNGLGDAEIFDVVAVAAARAFFAKLVDALGVQPDADFLQIRRELRELLTVGRPIAAEAPMTSDRTAPGAETGAA